MKSFQYSCRNKNGALIRGRINAESRADAITALKDKQLTVVELVETAESGRIPKSAVYGIIGAVVIIIIIVAAVALRSGKDLEPVIVPDVPAVTITNPEPAMPTPEVSENAAAVSKEPKTPVKKRKSPADSVPVSNPPKVQQPLPPGTPEENSETDETQEEPLPPAPPLVETLISMIGQPGEEMPPAPFRADDESLDAELENALNHTIEILESDDQKAADHKAYIGWIKQYMKEAKDEGMTAAQFLKDLEAFRKEEAAFRRECLAAYSETLKTGTPEEAESLRLELNASLEEHGLQLIPSREENQKRIQEIRARRDAAQAEKAE